MANLDEFLLNLHVREQSGTVPGTTRNSSTEDKEPNEDGYQKCSRPEVDTSIYPSLQSKESELAETSYRF